jgi:hypothetical protein
MKHFLVSSLVACAVLSSVALGLAGGSAAARHIPINHSPAPPLSTIEISNRNPTPTIVPPAASACTGCPPNAQASCVACPPGGETVQLNLVQLPL